MKIKSDIGKADNEWLRGLYTYMNDEHINTAVKKAVKELELV